jgi:hypothetical protein
MAITGADPNSRYRFRSNSDTWQNAEAACEGDAAHLVVFETDAERLAVVALVSTYTWVGDYANGSNTPWLQITGGPLADTAGWSTGQPAFVAPAPDGAALTTQQYTAEPFDNSYPFICECDGKSVVEP